ALYAAAVFVFWGVPLLLFGVRGFSGLSDAFWWGPLGASLALAMSVGALATALAFALCYGARGWGPWAKRTIAWLATVPLGVSSILLLLGWRLAFPEWLYSDSGRWLGVVLAQSLLAVPLAIRPLHQGFERLPEVWYRVSRNLGATPWQVLRWVEWPALRPAVGLAFLLGAALSLGETGSTLLFPAQSTQNLTYVIYHSMARYRFEQAYAGALVLLGLTAVLALLLSRLERGRAL
ncbi:ABC transporter permease subunit, partial [bacterium]|nr:ABC transporter permease subunit [bacterium]